MPQDTFDPRATPYSSVVRITEQLDGGWQASGVLLSPDEILTAGHATYRTGVGVPTNITVFESAMNSSVMEPATITHNIPSIANWPNIATSDVAQDYAILHLSTPVTGVTPMRLVAGPSTVTAHITGFPVASGTTMIDDVQTLTQVLPGVYQGSSEGGLLSPGISGGPVWAIGADGQANVYGVASAQSSTGLEYTSDFSQATVDQINEWVTADDAVPVAAAPPSAPTTPAVSNPVAQPDPVVVPPADPTPAPTPAPMPTPVTPPADPASVPVADPPAQAMPPVTTPAPTPIADPALPAATPAPAPTPTPVADPAPPVAPPAPTPAPVVDTPPASPTPVTDPAPAPVPTPGPVVPVATVPPAPVLTAPAPVAPATPAPVAQAQGVLLYDATTRQQLADTLSQPYTGPVAGIATQFIDLTADNLNITALTPNTFIHTGSGMDAIDVSHAGGNNVLDGGTGSNFLTGGAGSETFFVDARIAALDTWSTVVGFHSGDAATFWGVSPSSTLQWADGQGAAGATGLTLHAYNTGRPPASLTLAGFSAGDLGTRLQTVFGQDGSGSNYLYVHMS